MSHPYSSLPTEAFWKSAIAERSCFDVENLWQPKFRFDNQPIFTAGSCFAQHFGHALAKAGLDWKIAEKGPNGVSEDLSRDFNYGVFSTRTGNIYTTPILLQWLNFAFGNKPAPTEIWEKDGRFFDPLRPTIEPGGFSSAEELYTSRQVTLKAIRKTLTSGCVFVFTLGLTESWINADSGLHYAMCPGTFAGTFDPAKHKFKNLSYIEVMSSLNESIRIIREANKNNRILLTVSPVPLTATASGNHVLAATTYSKSVLRAVAGAASEARGRVDYFPSYEIITGIPFKSMWFEPNLRSVNPEGVNFVMKSFFHAHETTFGPLLNVSSQPTTLASAVDTVCEEEMLAAFGSKT